MEPGREFDAGEFPFGIDVTFEVGQKLRRVFKITQNKKGDVYLRIISGIRRGESSAGSLIREDRISLHASKTSSNYNTFKRTSSTADGATDVTVQLNTAVKSGKGFAHLTSIMFSDLAANIYDLNPSKQEQALVMGEFDASKNTAFCALFAGALRVGFNCGNAPFDIFKINTALFQIVIVGGMVSLPAISYSRAIYFGTLRPDEPFLGRRERERRIQKMQSNTPMECINAFSKQISLLISSRNHYLRVFLSECLIELEEMLQSAVPDEISLIELEILEAKKLLDEIRPVTQYIHIKDGSNPILYENEKGTDFPL